LTIRYTRSYDDILDDLSNALATIPKFYEAFEMNDTDWSELDDNEKEICVRTLADDVFYVLGSEPAAPVSTGSAEYDAVHGIIKVTAGPQLIHVVSLRE
jgi:hypothetical protein